MAVASARNLAAGSGTVSTTSGSKVLTFSSAQSLKEGAAVIVDPSGSPQYFTIDSGAGTTWEAMQNASATVSGKSFNTSDSTTTRARGGSNTVIIPNAAHFMYRATVDDSSNPDWYFYFDTLFPETGLHPYTKDQYTGQMWASSAAVAAFIPDVLTRVRILEGVVRGSAGSTTSADKRIKDLCTRITALETWANSTGHFGTPPAVGSDPTYTLNNLLSYGDAQ